MNLSKDDLSFALFCAKGYFYDSLNSDYPNKDDQKNAELFRDLEQAANNDTLEIEGYERCGWIKFNPNDPKTYPPKNTVVLLTIQGLPLEDNIHTWRTYLQERHNAQGLPGVFTHWRPLPKPPTEQDKGK